MNRIGKQELTQSDMTVQLPSNYAILSVHAQSNVPCLWGLYDDETQTTESRRFVSVTTGDALSGFSSTWYLGAASLDGDATVLHVFEVWA